MHDELQMGGIEELPAETTSALGRIALKHAQLDGILQTIIGALVGHGMDVSVQARARDIVQGQSTSELVRCVRKLAESADVAVATGADAWAQRVKQSTEERNASLHALWMVLPDGRQITMRLRRGGTSFNVVSNEDLARMELTQDELIAEGLEFAKQLNAE